MDRRERKHEKEREAEMTEEEAAQLKVEKNSKMGLKLAVQVRPSIHTLSPVRSSYICMQFVSYMEDGSGYSSHSLSWPNKKFDSGFRPPPRPKRVTLRVKARGRATVVPVLNWICPGVSGVSVICRLYVCGVSYREGCVYSRKRWSRVDDSITMAPIEGPPRTIGMDITGCASVCFRGI
jgi:hypothetical protein